MARRRPIAPSKEPFLRSVRTLPGAVDPSRFPFTIPAFAAGISLELRTRVTFFVGENGSGKSTLLEGLAVACGFDPQGGTRDHVGQGLDPRPALADALRLSWLPKVATGFFLRAESFFDFSRYVDATGRPDLYGGAEPLLRQSHGESFLSLFRNRFREGLFLLDEPEAALSPQRQLAFLRILADLERSGRTQFLIATHSPILLLYPGATVFSLDGPRIEQVRPEDTEHVQLTRDFLLHPDVYLRALLEPE
jgi:predicted ATPase